MNLDCDLAIVGSGFAGSLLAMAARRLGRSVVLLERARHPRFVIGESSTPLGNLLLEELSDRFDLPSVRSLSKWGTWQRSHPDIGCGLKRGFTFYHHRWGERCATAADRHDPLLVAASPRDEVADTHWYRPDFDSLLAREAERLGAVHLQEVRLESARFDDQGGCLEGQHEDHRLSVRTRLVVDGSGPRGFLFRTLGLGEKPMEHLPPTQSLYTHFRGVRRMEALPEWSGGGHGSEPPPYPVDDAALHHVFPGGWIWVLRFNNGIVSAGVVAEDKLATELGLRDGEAGWRRLLDRLPTVREQFAEARPVLPFVHSPRLPFRSARVGGPGWALLPYAAGFVDPLLSTGFPLTLLGVTRLATVLEGELGGSALDQALAGYADRTEAEFAAAERLVAALYASFDDFPLFSRLALLYFAAATFTETARRLGKPALAGGFLMHDHPTFGPALRTLSERAIRHGQAGGRDRSERAALMEGVWKSIEPIDVAGLCRQDRRGWYPVDMADLLGAVAKLGATETEVRGMLARCGFLQS